MAFSADERKQLTQIKGVGDTVVDRLEQIGIDNLATLAEAETDVVVDMVADMLGSSCWRNVLARRAIDSAIHFAKQTQS